MANEVSAGEKMITEMVFDALGDADNQLVIDFGDDGNTVFVTDNEDKKHYTITIKED